MNECGETLVLLSLVESRDGDDEQGNEQGLSLVRAHGPPERVDDPAATCPATRERFKSGEGILPPR